MNKLALILCSLMLFANLATAETSSMTGLVQSKCSIWTEVNGVYGNALSTKLDTLPARWRGKRERPPRRFTGRLVQGQVYSSSSMVKFSIVERQWILRKLCSGRSGFCSSHVSV